MTAANPHRRDCAKTTHGLGCNCEHMARLEGLGLDRNRSSVPSAPEILDKLEKLQVLTLQPGDILVATVAHGSFSVDRAARIKEQLKQLVPDNDVMVLADVELAALRTADGQRYANGGIIHSGVDADHPPAWADNSYIMPKR